MDLLPKYPIFERGTTILDQWSGEEKNKIGVGLNPVSELFKFSRKISCVYII